MYKLSLSFLLALAACGDDDAPPVTTDAGARDGGAPRDSGGRADSGNDDAGGGADAGDPIDAGADSGGGSDAGGGPSCGGLGGARCGPSEFCDYPDGSFCGAADETGICTPRPVACDAVLDPVCACDGTTYNNACEAHRAGVDDASPGECAGTTGCEGCAGACVGASCDGPWMCEMRPCTRDIVPWCGCDGRTFFSSSTCPSAPYVHMGECEVSCDARSVVCLALPPDCARGEVPSVEGACWGPCVPLEECRCDSDAACPVGACTARGRCG
jgi:hypothetical protein